MITTNSINSAKMIKIPLIILRKNLSRITNHILAIKI